MVEQNTTLTTSGVHSQIQETPEQSDVTKELDHSFETNDGASHKRTQGEAESV